MSAPLEKFLARLYVSRDARLQFKSDPKGEAARAGISPEECAHLEEVDWVGVEYFARTCAMKRAVKSPVRSWWRRRR